jgi:hypothetical protein
MTCIGDNCSWGQVNHGRKKMKFDLPKAETRWGAYVAAKMERGMTRAQAVKAVAKEHPMLRQRLVREANQPREDRR